MPVTTFDPCAWIGARAPEAPERLVARVLEVFAEHPTWVALPAADAFLSAGESLLVEVLPGDSGAARENALDLLASDACVTWAFEAAADAPATLTARAIDAMRRIAAAIR